MSDRLDRERVKFQSWLNSPEYQGKLMQRLKINDSCARSKESQILTYQLCKDDPIFFIENFGWTFDPRPGHEPHHLPFILFPYQKDVVMWIVDHIKRGEDGVIEKSRDMGVTWLLIYVDLWFWLFGDTYSALIGSYKEALVDNRTKDSIFGMLDYALINIPKWMMPARFKFKEHRQKLKLVNPQSYNLIAGDTMNPEFSRGSRKTCVQFDEGAAWEYFKDAWEAAGDTTPCRITVSTPKGRNAFAILRESGIDVLTVHWRLHPLKDDAWYEFEKTRRTDEEIAQELDISYHKSQEGRVYPEWDDVQYGLYPYDYNLPLFISWDFGFCVSSDTEALTRQGWKAYTDIQEGDYIYTLNQETRDGEWQPMRGKTVFSDKFEAVKIAGQSHSSLTTKGHKWFVINQKTGKGEFKTSEEFRPNDTIQCAAELGLFPGNEVYADSLVELMAWFWTEGQISAGGIELYQNDGEKAELIRDALIREYGDELVKTRNGSKRAVAGWRERPARIRTGGGNTMRHFAVNKNGTARLMALVQGNKVISYSFINKLSKRQLGLFVKRSIQGDGWETKSGARALTQTDKGRTEVFAYAATLLGYRIGFNESVNKSGNPAHGVHLFREKPFLSIYDLAYRRDGLSRVEYNGIVWCPTVDNKVWLAKRDGTVFFTGNTDDTAIIWWQTPQADKVRIIDAYSNHGKTIDFYVPFITGMISSETLGYSKKDFAVAEEHRNWKRGIHFGDPAGRFTNQVVNQSVIDVLRRNGIIVNFREEAKDFQSRKTAAKLLMRDLVVNDNERTRDLGLAIENSYYPSMRQGGMDQVRSVKPVHNWTSHYRSALEYYAVNWSYYQDRKKVHDQFPTRKRKESISGY